MKGVVCILYYKRCFIGRGVHNMVCGGHSFQCCEFTPCGSASEVSEPKVHCLVVQTNDTELEGIQTCFLTCTCTAWLQNFYVKCVANSTASNTYELCQGRTMYDVDGCCTALRCSATWLPKPFHYEYYYGYQNQYFPVHYIAACTFKGLSYILAKLV